MKKILAVISTLSLFVFSSGMAASISYVGDIEQGFNFDLTETAFVGHLNSLKIGGVYLINDLDVKNPEDYSGDSIKISGIMSSVSWEGGYADPIQFSSQVSSDNKNSLVLLQHTSLSDLSVEFQFTFYGYDPVESRYYKAFHSNGEILTGLIEKSGGDLNMNIDLSPSMEVVSPTNFTFSLGVMPADILQDIHLAVSLDSKFVKLWGTSNGSESVPIPSTISLLALGIIGLAGVSRKKID